MEQNSLLRLMNILSILRDPQKGCEWDRAQTMQSLSKTTLEEVYELIDAIESNQTEQIRDELGDLLFHIIFYSNLAKEQNLFDFWSICDAASNKLEQRHPHIFLSKKKISWEELKQIEREKKGLNSILDDLPKSLPAILRGEKLQKRCAAFEFDFENETAVLEKVEEEFTELKDELNSKERNINRIEEELGDLFFSLINLARHLNLNSEHVVKKSALKFEKRFRFIETELKKENKNLLDASIEEKEAL